MDVCKIVQMFKRASANSASLVLQIYDAVEKRKHEEGSSINSETQYETMSIKPGRWVDKIYFHF